MRNSVLMGLAAVLVITATGPQQADKEQKRFEGKWTMVSGEEMGKTLAKAIVEKASLVIEDSKYSVKVGEDTITGIQKVDPTKKPKQIDATNAVGPFKGKAMLGIYKLSKNRLTVCFAPPGKDRPKKFTTKSGTGIIFHVWKRAKGGE